ncbi:endonuclease/exonuclease/phosphatase family protein [Paenibacillus sp. F411]|nr:endonuclease/exonuclease/phosphatase family protein [Paenibacillus sp. F411]MBO2944344.1 endonuclease/exonuclease/phosphatase family protein [Paenibacillus sp. F411]
MKLMTLNTHAWQEEAQRDKIRQLAHFIKEQSVELVALQEVNQGMNAPLVETCELELYAPVEEGVPITEDNYAYVLQQELQGLGLSYYWTWVPVHVGFAVYDEGLAVLSRSPIKEAWSHHVSQLRDYESYRTRKILGVRTCPQGEDTWFVNGHYGWWEDEEPFRGQWDQTEERLKPYRDGPLYVMGDFNNVAQIRQEGYDYILQHGWHDLYTLARERDEGFTVLKSIAGWENNKSPLRIDYIISHLPVEVKSHYVVMNGERGTVVSDHFGVLAEVADRQGGSLAHSIEEQ